MNEFDEIEAEIIEETADDLDIFIDMLKKFHKVKFKAEVKEVLSKKIPKLDPDNQKVQELIELFNKEFQNNER